MAAVELVPARPAELPDFVTRLQRAFTESAADGPGVVPGEVIPSDDEVWESIRAVGAETLHVVRDGRRVGGAVVSIDFDRQRNSLDFFFIDGDEQGRGTGLQAWQAIESRYPATRVWTTSTPYFDTRNIHFYVNKCGFKVTEFFHPGHPGPLHPERSGGDDDLMFEFEKVCDPIAG